MSDKSVEQRTEDAVRRLQEPFHVDDIEFVNSAHVTFKENNGVVKDYVIAAVYVNPRKVMKRLDEAVGFLNWTTYIHEATEKECNINMTLTFPDGKLVTRSDSGIGKDRKSAVSDAIKRAGFQFGIGRYFYALPRLYVPAFKKKDSWDFKKSDAREVYIKSFRKLFPDKSYEKYITSGPGLGQETRTPASGTPAQDQKALTPDQEKERARREAEAKQKVTERGEELKREFMDRLNWLAGDITKENVMEWLTVHIEGVKLPDSLGKVLADDELYRIVKQAIEVDVLMLSGDFNPDDDDSL